MTLPGGPCAVCRSSAWSVAYDGPIRDGIFGRERQAVIARCATCGVEVLSNPAPFSDSYYVDGTYRADVGEQADPEDFFSRHDAEQLPRLTLLQDIRLRGRVVADVGAGGGSFLDAVSGYAADTIAIEPTTAYHQSLLDRGHHVFADTEAALAQWSGRVHVATCFSVIEHVADPVSLLADIRRLLTDDGVALISTPNRDDVLLAAGCEAYRRFFYRLVHLYYFDGKSLTRAAREAGFKEVRLVYRHRFPFSNFLGWLRDGRPTGAQGTSLLGDAFDRSWKGTLEQEGRADYLFAYLIG